LRRAAARIHILPGVNSAGGLIQDGDECADILMLLAAIRGWVNSLMALAR